eukprot:gene18337-13180_t
MPATLRGKHESPCMHLATGGPSRPGFVVATGASSRPRSPSVPGWLAFSSSQSSSSPAFSASAVFSAAVVGRRQRPGAPRASATPSSSAGPTDASNAARYATRPSPPTVTSLPRAARSFTQTRRASALLFRTRAPVGLDGIS